MIDLNIEIKAIKLLEGNIRDDLCNMGVSKSFLGYGEKNSLTKKMIN